MTYKFLGKDEDGKGLKVILRTTDGATIPFDPDNRDYQRYLEWVAEGNTADPFE